MANFSIPGVSQTDLGSAKGNKRTSPCGNIEGTEVSAKRFFVWLGSVTEREYSREALVKIGKMVGLTLIAEKSHLCGKAEVKLSTARQWFRWGHPSFPDENGKAKSDTYLTMPKAVTDHLTNGGSGSTVKK